MKNQYPGKTYRDYVEFPNEYVAALQKLDEHFFAEAHKEPLLLLLPILDIHAAFLYEGLNDADACFRAGRTNTQEKLDLIKEAWDSLRMMKHDGMGPLHCIQSYAHANNKCEFQGSDEHKHLVNRFNCIEKQISRTEELARDYLQHHVGRFSLEESRSTIKQAIVAFEETRRTKLSK